MFSLNASAHRIHGQFPEMLGIVVLARGEGVKATCEAIDGRLESDIVVIWEENVEAAVELSRGEVVEVPGDERATYQIRLRAL